jgi:NAD(P)-dependent dehydrogenase (short-subunit alcohol dehydrogenase family)
MTAQQDTTMNALIVGGNGGLGLELVKQLLARENSTRIVATYHRQRPAFSHPNLTWQALDVTDEAAIEKVWPGDQPLDLLVYAVGFLHTEDRLPEKTIRRFSSDLFLQSIHINTLPALLLAHHLQPALKLSPSPRYVAISARVGSITENRKGGWYSYRTSKAALNMALKTLSIEWGVALPRACVALLHPGTAATPLSHPFQSSITPETLFSASHSAGLLLANIDRLTPKNSGQFWSWDGSPLPW